MMRGVTTALLASVLLGATLLGACEERSVNVLEVAEVAVSPGELSVVQGASETLSARPRDAAGRVLSGRTIHWSSDDPSVARVDPEGRVEGLSPGTTRIRAAADQVEGAADVNVLPGPSIQLSAPTVTWEATAGAPDPLAREIQVTNSGNGTLADLQLEVTDPDGTPPDWLQATLQSTTAPATIQLQASAADLGPGDYSATLEVSSPVAVDGDAQVDLLLQVREPPPVIALDPTSWSSSAPEGSLTPSSQTVAVANEGGGVLDELSLRIEYTGGGATGWLNAELESGTAPTRIEMEASSRELDPGQYTARVIVSSPAAGEDAEVHVTFSVQARSQVERP